MVLESRQGPRNFFLGEVDKIKYKNRNRAKKKTIGK